MSSAQEKKPEVMRLLSEALPWRERWDPNNVTDLCGKHLPYLQNFYGFRN